MKTRRSLVATLALLLMITPYLALDAEGATGAGPAPAAKGTATPASGDAGKYSPLADGSLDPDFGAGGRVVTQAGNVMSLVGDIAVLPDGKILLAGVGDERLALLKLEADGRADTTFGYRGKVLGAGDELGASRVELLPDGKLLVAGSGVASPFQDFDADFALFRFNSDGSHDLSFGNGGKAMVDLDVVPPFFGRDDEHAGAMALQPDGKIVIAGGFYGSGCPPRGTCISTSGWAILRFMPDGRLDPSFGEGGTLRVTAERPTYSGGLILQSDGKIVLSRWAIYGPCVSAIKLNRYLPNGAADTTFGLGGEVTTRFPGAKDHWAGEVALADDDKILLAAGSRQGDRNITAVLRYNADGTLDSSFGTGGGQFITLAGSVSELGNLRLQNDGRILLGGATYTTSSPLLPTVLRLLPNGALDPTWGEGGVAGSASESGSADALAIAPDGKIIAAGRTALQSQLIGVRRFLNEPAPMPEPRPPATSPAPISAPVLADVCPSDYFYAAVNYLLEQGVVSGYEDDTFRPFNNATRAQVAKIVVLWRGWEIDTAGGPHFSDVPTSNPFYQFVETAHKHGALSGYLDGTFKPFADVTRGQLSKIIVLARGWPLERPDAPTFVDVLTNNPFYQEIETAVAHGIIGGYELPDGKREFRWQNNATRGQIAKIVHLAGTGE